MNPTEFNPVPGIWRFHLIYLILSASMAWAFLPYDPVYQSLVLVVGFCMLGLLMALGRQILAAHVMALTVGLGLPIVLILRPVALPTFFIFVVLLLGIIHYRDDLF